METMESLIQSINELRDLIGFLECELLNYSVYGNYDGADRVYGELIDARKKLEQLEQTFDD